MNIKYAATLAFSEDLRKVALIQKKRPQFLAGKWTVIGGNVESGEMPVNAAMRELGEEAGLYVADYHQMAPFACIEWRGQSACQMYATVVPNVDFAQTKTDERVMVWDVATLPAYQSGLSEDLCALVELAKMALRNPHLQAFSRVQVSR
jgi:8-oxo-dGTP pyrophosphatase MutT (NUDIX family)